MSVWMRLPVLGLLLLGCASQKVEVRLQGRPAESLQARADREDGSWTVDVDLPQGQWEVDLPEEGRAVRVVDRGGRPHARWETTGERLLAKPFRVRLRPKEGGEPLWLEVRGRFVGQGFFEGTARFLRGGRLPP